MAALTPPTAANISPLAYAQVGSQHDSVLLSSSCVQKVGIRRPFAFWHTTTPNHAKLLAVKPEPTAPVIWWIRRDLRLRDNMALTAACNRQTAVLPLFILDPFFVQSPYASPRRFDFLVAGLHELDQALQTRGSRLIVRQGDPIAVLPAFVAETGATAVFVQPDDSSYARQRDGHLAKQLPLHFVGSPAIQPADSVRKKDGTPYTVFTPYSRTWLQNPPPTRQSLLPPPAQIKTPSGIMSKPLPAISTTSPFTAGEAEGQRRLQAFMANIGRYASQRDFMAEDGTSRLSPYLRFGMVSARETAVYAYEAQQNPDAEKGAATWLNELIWRDFYLHILHAFPHVSHGNFRPRWNGIPWRNNQAEFAAWCAGQTGYPIVDAAMRQLNQTGWMHNRARMIVASFLVKDLLIDWRWGERYFMQQLIDGDPAANNGGWQWAAGTGTDAAPYFRIFNPVSQSKKFDPAGDYLRRWLPELTAVSSPKQLHEPWTMPSAQRRNLAYPEPIVDHKMARQRTLAAYKAAQAQGG